MEQRKEVTAIKQPLLAILVIIASVRAGALQLGVSAITFDPFPFEELPRFVTPDPNLPYTGVTIHQSPLDYDFRGATAEDLIRSAELGFVFPLLKVGIGRSMPTGIPQEVVLDAVKAGRLLGYLNTIEFMLVVGGIVTMPEIGEAVAKVRVELFANSPAVNETLNFGESRLFGALCAVGFAFDGKLDLASLQEQPAARLLSIENWSLSWDIYAVADKKAPEWSHAKYLLPGWAIFRVGMKNIGHMFGWPVSENPYGDLTMAFNLPLSSSPDVWTPLKLHLGVYMKVVKDLTYEGKWFLMSLEPTVRAQVGLLVQGTSEKGVLTYVGIEYDSGRAVPEGRSPFYPYFGMRLLLLK